MCKNVATLTNIRQFRQQYLLASMPTGHAHIRPHIFRYSALNQRRISQIDFCVFHVHMKLTTHHYKKRGSRATTAGESEAARDTDEIQRNCRKSTILACLLGQNCSTTESIQRFGPGRWSLGNTIAPSDGWGIGGRGRTTCGTINATHCKNGSS